MSVVKHIYNVKLFDDSRKPLKRTHLELLKNRKHIDVIPDKHEIKINFEPYNKGNLGSCTSHGICACYRILHNQASNADFNPSRLFLYYRERAIEHALNREGAVITDGLTCLEDKGTCSEIFWPYVESQENVRPPTLCYGNAWHHKILSWGFVANNPDVASGVKQILLENKPVIFGMQVYSSFESDAVASNGIVPMPDVNSENLLGGHCLCITGFDDNKKWFKVLNSGGNWGEKGYCYIPYDYINDSSLCDSFVFIQSLNDTLIPKTLKSKCCDCKANECNCVDCLDNCKC